MRIFYTMIFSTFLLAVYFPVSSHSQIFITATCNAQLVNNEDNATINLGEASTYRDSNKNASIVIKWQNGTVLTATRTEIGTGNRTSWQWVNTLGYSGTMSLSPTSSTSFSGPFTFNNATLSITLLNCRYAGENRAIPGIGVFFHNTGTIPLTVLVNETDGPRPPDPSQSTVVFSGPPTSTRNSAAGLSLAYGCYSFCVHWNTGTTDRYNQIIYSYRFIGRLPDRPAICLNENTPTIPAPVVRVSTGEPVRTGVGYAGQCPGVGQAGQRNNPPVPQSARPQGQQNVTPQSNCDCTDPATGKRFRPFLGQDCANAIATNMMDFNCQ